MLKFILNNWRLVKIGTTQAQRKLFFNLRKEREKLAQAGFDPTSEAIAKALDVPEREVIDMEKRTKDWLMALGPTSSVTMFATDDNTHLNMQGAVEVAKLAVAGIRALGLPIAARALP